MAEIDSLEIKISSDAAKANNAINSLIKNLGRLSNYLNIDTSGLEKIGKSLNLSEIGKSAKAINEKTQKISKSVAEVAKDFQNKFKDISVKVDFSKPEAELQKFQKQAQTAKNALSRIMASSSADKQINSIEKWSISLAQATNAVDILEKHLAGIKTMPAFSPEFEEKLRAEFGNVKATVDVEFETDEQYRKRIQEQFPELKQSVKIDSANAKYEMVDITKYMEDFANKVSKTGNLSETLGNKLKNIVVPEIREENITKLQSALKRTEENLEKLRVKLANGLTMGKITESIDDSKFVNLQEQIAYTEKYAEALRNKISQIGTGESKTNKETKNLSNAFNKLRTNASGVSNSIGGLGKSLNKTLSGMKSVTRSILSATGIMGGIYGGIRAIKSSVESSMGYIETLNYFNAAFGQVAEKADYGSFKEMGYNSAETYYNSFSDRAEELTEKMTGFAIEEGGRLIPSNAKTLGINPSQLMNYQAMFAQMSSSMGTTSENALKLSTVLTEIGADLASVKNMKFDKVWNDMASGLAGMSRTLDKYGANIRNVNLQQKLSELGIAANISALNQNDKALLRTIILLDSTRYAWGDLANTINQPANQLRLLQSNFSNLARTIGNIFLPIVAKVLPYINMFVVALQRLAEFIVKLLGFEDFNWGGGQGNAGDVLSDVYDNAEDATGALDDVSKSAKKAKAGLRAFDELKTIEMPDGEKENGGGTGAGAGAGVNGLLQGALDSILEEYQNAWDKAFSEMEERANTFANNVAEAFKEGGLYGVGEYFSESLTEALNNIPWNSVYKGVKNFGTGLAQFLNGLISPELFGAVGKTIASSLNTALYFLNSFGTTFDWKDFGESIAQGINDFFSTFDFAKLAKTLNTWVDGIKDAIGTALKNISWSSVFEGGVDFLTNLELDTVVISVAAFKWFHGGKEIVKAGLKSLLDKKIATGIGDGSVSVSTAISLSITTAIAGFKIGNWLYENVDSIHSISDAIGEWIFKDGEEIDIARTISVTLGGIAISIAATTLISAITSTVLSIIPSTGVAIAGIKLAFTNMALNIALGAEAVKAAFSTWATTTAIPAISSFFTTILPTLLPVSGYLITIAAVVVASVKIGEKIYEWASGEKSQGDLFDLIFGDYTAEEVWTAAAELTIDVQEKMSKKSKEILDRWDAASEETAEELLQFTLDVKEKINDKTKKFIDWFSEKKEETKDLIANAKTRGGELLDKIRDKWDKIKEKTKELIANGKANGENSLSLIRDKWDKIKTGTKNLIANAKEKGSSALDKIKQKWDKIKTGTKVLTATFKDAFTAGIKKAWNGIAKALNNAIDVINKIPGVDIKKVPTLSTGSQYNNGKWVKQYAAGGFPDMGQLFIAREAGPELVGNIGGNTSVMNNDQIVSSVSDGVYRAVRAAMSTGYPVNVTFKVEGDRDKIFKITREEAENYFNRTGNPAYQF